MCICKCSHTPEHIGTQITSEQTMDTHKHLCLCACTYTHTCVRVCECGKKILNMMDLTKWYFQVPALQVLEALKAESIDLVLSRPGYELACWPPNGLLLGLSQKVWALNPYSTKGEGCHEIVERPHACVCACV